METEDLSGKKILVIGGSAHEVIDGVRHYANHGRPEQHGLQAAKRLAELGAKVTLVTTRLHDGIPQGIAVVSEDSNHKALVGAESLLNAAAQQAQATGYDAVLQLANIPAVKAAKQSEHKLKVKKDAGALIPMDVAGNIDVVGSLQAAFSGSVIAGYDSQQQWFASGDAGLAKSMADIASQTASAPLPATQDNVSALPRTGGKLSGKKIIITSGPTAEPISSSGDVITNFSSGKQGHAVAESLAAMGAQVVLVSGPTHIPDPSHPNITTIHTESARNMRDAVVAQLPADAFVAVAAVADFGMANPGKLALKPAELATLELSQNPDILQTIGTHGSKRPSVVIGFAAETHDLLIYARGKLEKKGADAICANQVGSAMVARGSDKNQITWVSAEGNEPWETMGKSDVGNRIGDKIALLLQRKKSISAGSGSSGLLSML
jgi:phosphopantothenoylcysteine synthetase/decarboxylase